MRQASRTEKLNVRGSRFEVAEAIDDHLLTLNFEHGTLNHNSGRLGRVRIRRRYVASRRACCGLKRLLHFCDRDSRRQWSIAKRLAGDTAEVFANCGEQNLKAEDDEHRWNNDRSGRRGMAHQRVGQPVPAAVADTHSEEQEGGNEIQAFQREIVNVVLEHDPPHEAVGKFRRKLQQYATDGEAGALTQIAVSY